MQNKGVPRRSRLDTKGIRRQGSKEKGFRYGTPDGKLIREERVLQRIVRLRIPPAWTNVRIAASDSEPLQAVGLDRKGRTQYIYSSKFRSKREEEKFRRVVEFGEVLPKLRRQVLRDLKGSELSRQRVVASIVRLIDQKFFRVGNDKSAKSEDTYGLTTVRTDHVRIRKPNRVEFDFVGKWQKSHKKTFDDKEVASIIGDLCELGGKELFQYVDHGRVLDIKDRHVNDYIQTSIGEQFTAKDFRTWAGTLICAMELAAHEPAGTKKERKRSIKKAIEATAGQLGNTPTVCRTSYICPRLLEDYVEGRPFEMLRKTRKGTPVAKLGLSIEERALLKFLRETIADRRSAKRAA